MTPSPPSLYDSFARYGSGVTLVTVRDGDQDHYFIAASVLTASVDPFTLAVSVSSHRDALPAITTGNPWSVSILAAHHLQLVQELTGRGSNEDRLQALQSAGAERSPEGPLHLPDALVTLWCTTHSTTPVNDQILVVGNVTRGSHHQPGGPLIRWNRKFCTVSDLLPPPPSRAVG